MSQSNGHKHPPKKHRFKPGESGNKNGRPKKKREVSVSAFDIILDRTLPKEKSGETGEVSAEEALHHQVFKKAMEGDKSAIRDVLKWIDIREKYRLKHREKQNFPSAVIRIEPTDPENAYEAMALLDIAHVSDDENYQINGPPIRLLEHWATQAALSRRRGGSKLTQEDVEWIKSCTKGNNTIKWPKETKP